MTTEEIRRVGSMAGNGQCAVQPISVWLRTTGSFAFCRVAKLLHTALPTLTCNAQNRRSGRSLSIRSESSPVPRAADLNSFCSPVPEIRNQNALLTGDDPSLGGLSATSEIVDRNSSRDSPPHYLAVCCPLARDVTPPFGGRTIVFGIEVTEKRRSPST